MDLEIITELENITSELSEIVDRLFALRDSYADKIAEAGETEHVSESINESLEDLNNAIDMIDGGQSLLLRSSLNAKG